MEYLRRKVEIEALVEAANAANRAAYWTRLLAMATFALAVATFALAVVTMVKS